MPKQILQTTDLTKYFVIGDRRVKILDSVSISINEGSFTVISGSSGSGKTTLLSLMAGLDKPSAGRIIIDSQDITDLSENALAPFRNKITGFVFQSFHLIPSLNTIENIMFPAELNKDKFAWEKAVKLIKRVGLWDRRHNFPIQLSGGEKQRAAICRALINGPKLIFADEPTGNLDSKNSEAIIGLLRELQQEHNTTLIMATHSSIIAKQADQVVNIHDGVIKD